MADSPISALTQVTGDLPNAAWLVADDLGVTKKLSQTQLLITDLKSPSTLASTCKLQIYDTDNALYRDFITGTAGVTPRLDIAAPSGGEIFIDGATIGSTTAANATFNIATVNTDLNLANGCFVRSGIIDNDEFFIQAYDVDAGSYKTFITVLSANTPQLIIEAPSGTSARIDDIPIGGITPAAGSFTELTLSNNGALRTSAVVGNTAYLHVYDTTSLVYRNALTMTAGLTPSFSIGDSAVDGLIDYVNIGSVSPGDGSFSNLNLSGGGAFTLGNLSFVRSGQTSGNSFSLDAYDVDGASYVSFMTVTSGNTPNLSISSPAGATLSINGAVIGDISPADASFTNVTMSNAGEIRGPTTTGQIFSITAYDTDDLLHREFITSTAGTNPTFSIGGANIAGVMDNVVIGGSVPAQGTFNNIYINGDVRYSFSSTSISTDVLTTYLFFTSLASPLSARLMSVDAAQAGLVRVVVDAVGNASTNNITVTTQGSETINGSSTHVIDTNYGFAIFVSDGANWILQNSITTTGGGGNFTVTNTAVSANATTDVTNVTSNAAARTITLLSADASVSGTVRMVKDAAGTAGSSNNITIATQGAETIDGASTLTITANYGVARMYSDGTNWLTY